MKPAVFIPIIIGSLLLTAGAVVFGIGLASASKNTTKVTTPYELEETITGFDIDLDTSNLEFKVSTDDSKKVICNENKKNHHEVKVVDSVLTIKQIDERKWHEKLFDFSFNYMKVEVYLPSSLYNSLSIHSSTGDIVIPHDYSFNSVDIKLNTGNVSFKSNVATSINIEASTGDITISDLNTNQLTINTSTGDITANNVAVVDKAIFKASTGKIRLNNLTAANLDVNTSTGDVTLTNTVILNHINIHCSTGDVKLEDSDAKTLNIETSTGDITGTLLTEKRFFAHSHTGKVDVPETDGERCDINTDTGKIIIKIR